jgi:hypothetical protein
MAKLRISLGWERLLEALDPFRHVAKAIGVAFWIAAAFVVGDDCQAFAESGGELV